MHTLYMRAVHIEKGLPLRLKEVDLNTLPLMNLESGERIIEAVQGAKSWTCLVCAKRPKFRFEFATCTWQKVWGHTFSGLWAQDCCGCVP